jgi:cytochrome c2
MKRLIVPLGLFLLLAACGGGEQKKTDTSAATTTETPTASSDSDEKGIGPIKDVKLTNPLDQAMITAGKGVYDLKCSSCHRLTAERLVGPGWLDVTKRRKPEWIMNFSTNVDEMLNKDPKAQAMLEECLVRMPNQNLSEQDARNVLEFMRKNDGEK